MKLSGFKYLVNLGVKGAIKNKIMSFTSICILMVSLLLVGLSVLFTMNINKIVGVVEDKNEVVIFLVNEVTDEELTSLKGNLEKDSNISQVVFYSKEEALEQYKNSMGNSELVFESLEKDNPLPDSYRIKIKDITMMEETISAYTNIPFIDTIKAPHDFATLLTGVKKAITLISMAVVIALIIVSLVIISNTTRASVFARRKEINIMKYVGASNSFIRIPFFVEGMFIGIISAVVALILTCLCYNSLFELITGEIKTWNMLGFDGFIPFKSVVLPLGACYLIAGSGIGAIGCMFSTRKHLKV